MLFLVGIPMFFLELAIGQFSALGPTHTFYRMAPIFQGIVTLKVFLYNLIKKLILLIIGLGYAALTINAFIGFYYNVIIAYCLYYLVLSMNSVLPWSTCGNEWNTPQCIAAEKNCTTYISNVRRLNND